MSRKQLTHYELRQRQSWIDHDNNNFYEDWGDYPEDAFEEALNKIRIIESNSTMV